MPKGALICPSCISRLSFVESPVCQKCGKEVRSDVLEYCPDCQRHRRSFEYGTALLNYNEAAAHSMAAIKYKNKREYLDFYAGESAKRLGPVLLSMKADALIPVPVHPKRLRKRGFNQAGVLAEKLGELLSIPVEPHLLYRIRNTEAQKELSASERLKNLEKAFAVSEPQDPRDAGAGSGKNMPECVILVDDIYTTGSTIEACTRVLKRAGVKKVYFFAVCIGQRD